MMACPGATGVQAQAYTKALGATKSYSVSGDKLTLKDSSGKELMTMTTLKPAALAGTNWVATSINNGKGAVSSVVANTKVTALFGSDGKLSGNDGCNSYNGPYKTSGTNGISIGPLAATKMACDQATMDQESQYLAALGKAATYTLGATTLELRDSSGALMVQYVAGQ